MTPKELNAIAAQLAAQIANIRRKSADVVPPGWFTARELSKARRCDVSTVLYDVKQAGAECKKFHVVFGKSLKSIPHYKLK